MEHIKNLIFVHKMSRTTHQRLAECKVGFVVSPSHASGWFLSMLGKIIFPKERLIYNQQTDSYFLHTKKLIVALRPPIKCWKISDILFSVILLLFLFYLPNSLSENAYQDTKDNLVKFSLVQGEVKNHNIPISNKENITATYLIETQNLENFVTTEKNRFSLAPGEEKVVGVNVFALSDQVPGVYFGKLIIKETKSLTEPDIVKVINYLIEVGSKEPFFKIIVNLGKYKEGTLPIIIDVTNIKAPTPADVRFELYVEDINKEIISSKKEKLSIKGSFVLVEDIKMDQSKVSEFIIYVKIRYEGEVSVGSNIFGDINKLPPPKEVFVTQQIIKRDDTAFLYISFSFIILILIIIVSFDLLQNKKLLNIERKYKSGYKKDYKRIMKKEKQISKNLYKELNSIEELRERINNIENKKNETNK